MVLGGAGFKEPAGAFLGVFAQQVDLVVAQDRHGTTGRDQLLHQRQYARAVGAPVAEVAHEHQGTPVRVVALCVIAQVLQQRLQGIEFAMDVTDDVQGAGRQGLDQTHG